MALASTLAVAQEAVRGAGISIQGVDERVSPLQSLDSQTQNGDEADTAINRRINVRTSKWSPERNPDISAKNEFGSHQRYREQNQMQD